MRISQRTKLCLLINFIGLIGIIIFVLFTAEFSELFKFGPDEFLTVMSVRINTWPKYIGIVITICVIKALEVGVNDIGSPNLGFSIYDPTTEIVYGFKRMELQLLANGMFIVNSLSSIFTTMIFVSRFDVALISVLSGEIASACTIYYLLGNKKQFIHEFDTEEESRRSCELQSILISDDEI